MNTDSVIENKSKKALFSLVLFSIFYFILIFLAIYLNVLVLNIAIELFLVKKFLTIIIGIGLIIFSSLILFFLIKFIFQRDNYKDDSLIEIKRNEQEKLFDFIDDIAHKVGSDSPNKILISYDVNAGVMYNKSLFGMFFKRRKDLLIGIGLVNSLNIDEFKSVLSHEFAHFSQKGLNVSTYFYKINKIIINTLYDNEFYEEIIQKLSNIFFFSIFVLLSFNIVKAIQFLLRKVYEYISIDYMDLSREMEFNADKTAAEINSSQTVIQSLLRTDLADYSINSVLSFYISKSEESIKSSNIFKEQSFVMDFIAKEDNIPIINGFPSLSISDLKKYNKSKLDIKDQWASHPTLEERVSELEKLNINIDNKGKKEKAISLFNNIEKLEIELTEKIFSNIPYVKKEITQYTFEHFKKEYEKDFINNSFNKIYNSYYDMKNINYFDIDKIKNPDNKLNFDDLFNKQKIEIVYEYIYLEEDIKRIKELLVNNYHVRTFTYDGKKYYIKDIDKLINELNIKFDKLKDVINQNDINIFNFFYKKAKIQNKEELLIQKYNIFFSNHDDYYKKFEIYSKVFAATEFINYITSNYDIEKNLKDLEELENLLKDQIKDICNKEVYKDEIKDYMKENFNYYLSNKMEYFNSGKYNDNNLIVLFNALQDFYFLIIRAYFIIKKDLLDYQADLLDT